MSTNEMSGSERIVEVEAQLIRQARQDAEFRDRLLTNPEAVLAE